MLLELAVSDFAIIDQVKLPLAPGFNVLTGETGAGKSILIDAVEAVLGGRVSADLIRSGRERAVVEAVFAADSSAVCDMLIAAGIDCSDSQVIITREISRQGRSVCRINGRAVTAQVVRGIASLLVEICGQMEQQSLTDARDRLLLLDRFAGRAAGELRSRVLDLYGEYVEMERKSRDLAASKEARQRRIDILTHQLDEIEAAGLGEGEWEELTEQRQVLASAESLLAAASRSFAVIYEGGSDKAVIDALSEALADLEDSRRIDSRLETISDEVRDCYFRLQAAGRDLARYRDQIVFDPGALARVDERLELWRELMRKYGKDFGAIVQYRDAAARELEELSEHNRQVDQSGARIQSLLSEIRKLATQLHDQRVAAAQHLEQAVAAQLSELGLEHGTWQVQVRVPGDVNDDVQFRNLITADGIDECQMLFSANPDEPVREIGKVASGGELARLMLAVKTVIADTDQVGTIIFDEIDANIGGRMAQAVAARITAVSTRRQVICVTHQPQIAAVGHAHFCVVKSVADGTTRVDVQELDAKQREAEIARMLGGVELTTVTEAHARELLRGSDKG